jgi:hypothetical protein
MFLEQLGPASYERLKELKEWLEEVVNFPVVMDGAHIYTCLGIRHENWYQL